MKKKNKLQRLGRLGDQTIEKGKVKGQELHKKIVRQEKAAGRLGTKLKNLITNLRGRPRGR